MSQVSDAATVRILMADYAAVDQGGKLNVVGGGLVGIPRSTPEQSTPVFLVVMVSVPATFQGVNGTIEVTLEDDKGNFPEIPGPSGELGPFRITQNLTFQETTVEVGQAGPTQFLNLRFEIVVSFWGGLPLPGNVGYLWRVSLDGQTRDDWTERFLVAESK